MAMAAETRNTTPRRWGLIVLLTVLGAGAGLAYALISSAQYTAKAYVAVVAQDPGDSSAVSYAQAFSRIASQGDALQTAADASQGSASVEELRRSVLAAASPDAPVIELTGTAGTPERAADLVNLLGNGLIKTANSHTADTRMRLALLSAAVPPADPTSPQLPLAVAVGAAAGLLLGGLALLGRGERYQPDRPAGHESGDPSSPDPVGAGQFHDANNTIERLANWTGRAPSNVMTRFGANRVKPPPDGIGKQGTAAQSEEPDSVRDVIPAARQEGRGADRTTT
jgi:capsular polysaccharide biosynthesis protein